MAQDVEHAPEAPVLPRARLVVLAMLLVAALVALATSGDAAATAVRDAAESRSVFAPAVFVGLYAALTIALVPGAIGSAVAGAVFGPVWGIGLTIVGATIGATASFLIARWLGRAQVERFAGKRVAAVDGWLDDRGMGAVLFLRLVPLFPFNAVNYGAGLTSIPLGRYVTGTAIGIVPGTVAFVGLGAGFSGAGTSTLIGSLLLLTLLTVAGVVALRMTPATVR